MTDNACTPTRHQPRYLLPILVVLILIGALSIGATIAAARDADLARRSDVQRTEVVLRDLEQLVDEHRGDIGQHRIRNEEAHAVLCEIARTIALAERLTVPECPAPLPPELLDPHHEETP